MTQGAFGGAHTALLPCSLSPLSIPVLLGKVLGFQAAAGAGKAPRPRVALSMPLSLLGLCWVLLSPAVACPVSVLTCAHAPIFSLA